MQRIGHDLVTEQQQQCYTTVGFPRWLSGKESACQCRRREFDPWVGKIPWRRVWQPTPVFSSLVWKIPWTEEPGGLSLWGHKTVRHDLATKQQ